MYKKQMTLQRIVCYVVLIAAALVFVYSLGFVTDMYSSQFPYYAEGKVDGTEIFYEVQEFNKQLTTVGIVLILLATSQFLFQNHNRRRYYIANYITVGVNAIAAVVASVWALNNIFTYRAQYLLVDFEELQKRAEMFGEFWTDSTFWFDISKTVFGILLVATVLNVLNLIFKVIVMRAERKLVEAGKEA